MHQLLLRRVRIRNYRSIEACDVQLYPFTLLVGRNGSGKSNFLDALRFVSDGLRTSLDHALRDRGNLDAVRRRSTGHPNNFGIQLEINLPDDCLAYYGFEIASRPKKGFVVRHEQARIVGSDGVEVAEFRVALGKVVSARLPPTTARNEPYTLSGNGSLTIPMPPAAGDRLYLVTAAGLPQFRPLYDALLAVGFYNLNPEQMKEVQSPDAGDVLRRDGSNIASVVSRIAEEKPELHQRICEFLKCVVPGIVHFGRVPLGHRETLEFRQEVKGAEHPWRFYAQNMSDGTLRTLGVLVAAMQLVDGPEPMRFVGIEEPETALHPAAAGVLMDSLREASQLTQIVITTHSPDLLERFDPATDHLLAVASHQGTTEIATIDAASREAIQKHLYSAGELLRMNQLEPDPQALERQQQLQFVEGPPAA